MGGTDRFYRIFLEEIEDLGCICVKLLPDPVVYLDYLFIFSHTLFSFISAVLMYVHGWYMEQ